MRPRCVTFSALLELLSDDDAFRRAVESLLSPGDRELLRLILEALEEGKGEGEDG